MRAKYLSSNAGSRELRIQRRFAVTPGEIDSGVADHERDYPIGPRIVVVEGGLYRGQLRPILRALFGRGVTRAQLQHLFADLNRHFRLGLQVEVPQRVFV